MNDETNYAQIIFEDLFKIRVPKIATLSEYDVENGVVMDSYNNTAGLDQPVEIMATINKMVEIDAMGHTIHICKHTNIPYIFEVIQNHIARMNRHYDNNVMNSTEYPQEDLEKLDAFAKSIYSVNGETLVKNTMTRNNKSSFLRGSVFKGSVNNDLTLKDNVGVTIKSLEDIGGVNNRFKVKDATSKNTSYVGIVKKQEGISPTINKKSDGSGYDLDQLLNSMK